MKLLTEKTSKSIIWAGLIIIMIGCIVFSVNETFFMKDSILKADKVGQLGDFIGEIAGALWALAGVILFYVALGKQKEALSILEKNLSFSEMNLSRQEMYLKGRVKLKF